MRFIDINVLRQMIHYLLYVSIKWTVFCHLPIYYLMFCLLQNTYLSTIFHQIVLKLKYISWKIFYNICDKHSLLLDVCTFPFYRDYLVHYSYQSHCSVSLTMDERLWFRYRIWIYLHYLSEDSQNNSQTFSIIQCFFEKN